MKYLLSVIIFLTCFFTKQTSAVDINIDDKDSICDALSLVAEGLMDYYDGYNYGGVIGMFQNPYYWWQAGEAWGGMIDYGFFCNNDTYDDLIYDALIYQKGDDNNYIPSNQSTTEGNDDQGFWGIAVMEAAERNFTNPTGDTPGWIALAQAVFNTMWSRWDSEHCGGGLRWQIFTWNSGYDYKNTVSTACLYNIATRLGRYTGNETYFEVADEAFEWLIDAGFVIEGDATKVYDGADIDNNCSSIVKIEWTYNYALLLGGSAYAYNATSDEKYLTRTNSLVQGSLVFFDDDIAYERACQGSSGTGSCNNDQRSFKSVFARSLGQTSVLVPSTYDTIRPLFEASAEAAAKSCSGGSDGHTCGLRWSEGSWDGVYGLGEQMSALEFIQNLLVAEVDAPYTNDTGGTSVGDSSAGISSISDSTTLDSHDLVVTTKDKAGSGVITAFVLAVLVGGSVWMVI